MKSTSTLLKSLEKEPTQTHEGIKTDFPEFDEFTGGLQPGQLIVMAGRPGMGIQAFTRCLVLNTSIRHHNTVGLVLLEQSTQAYLQRMIATEAGISHHELTKDDHSKQIFKKINIAKEIISKAPIFINDDLEYSLDNLIARIIDFTKAFRPSLLVIHGYELLTFNNNSKVSEQGKIDAISKELKHLAEALNISLIITHELPIITSYNNDQDVKPVLKELYSDTPLAKYADLVMFLYRPEYYKFKTWYDTNESCECEAELVIAKNRHGSIHSFRLFFDGYRSRFNEIDDERFVKQPWVANN